MRKLLAALAGLAGLAWWRTRTAPAPAPRYLPPPAPQPDPAEELREKLAQARGADDREEFEAGEKAVDEVADADVETRRRDVHDRARGAIDELSSE